MTSRRAFLAGFGTVGTAGLAGCSSLLFGGQERESRTAVSVPSDAVEPIAWPEPPFPVAIPSSLADAHRERARELLSAVPAAPSVPNGAVAEELRSKRERASARLDDDVDESWPTETLAVWRSRRNAAASVHGAHRAATGEDDAATVTDRRRAVREELGSFVSGHEYRASSPLEAVLAHAPIEELLADCHRRVRPDPPYPADPIAHPFRAGDAVGRLELARAALDDARRLREVYLTEHDGASDQWATLIEGSGRLRLAVMEARSTVREFLDVSESPFEADLEGTVARSLFRAASRRAASTVEDNEESHDDGVYATAVIEAGRALCAVETLRTTIEAIRDGAHRDEATVESVTRTSERAQEAIATALEESDHRRLATHILRDALGSFEYVSSRIERGHADAARLQGELLRGELYARTVPAASAFVADRLEPVA